MTPAYIAACKAIYDTLTANPMPRVVATIAADGALNITYDDLTFSLRDNQWFGGGPQMFSRLNSISVGRASTVHAEIARVAAVMAAADGKPSPQHRSDLFEIGGILGHTGAMNAEEIALTAKRIKRQSDAAREYNHRILEIHHALGISPTAPHEDAVKVITTIRQTDPLGMLGAPAAYANGEALTVKERLLYLLARVAE